jgi:hypothetical protein
MWWPRWLDEMVLNAPLERTVLMIEELDREEIKKRIKSTLGSIPSNDTLDLHPPMHPNDGFIKMVSAPHPPSSPFSLRPFAFLSFA